jgi:hypothetical protein
MEVNNTFTGVGMERVLTDSDISTGGAAVDAQYRFDNATAEADPGNGDFRMDNATPASVTELFISSTTDNNNDFDNMLGFLSSGDQIYIQQDDDATKFILFDVTANVDNTGWYSIAGTINVSGTIFGNNAKCHIILLFGGTGGGGGSLTAPVIALADINTATPPVAEAVTGAYEIWDADETDLLGRLGYSASNDLILSNRMHNGEVRLTGEDAGGTTRTFFLADPNSIVDITAQTSLRLFIDGGNNAIIATGGAGVDLYHNNIERFGTGAAGVVTVRSDDNVQSSTRMLAFAMQNGTRQGFIGHETGSVFHIRSESHGQNITVSAEDAGGIVRTLISGDPDGDSFARATRHFTIQTNITEDALVATQNADVALFYNDIKKLRTDAFGAAILANINTATPPTTEAVNGRLWFRDLADNDDLGYVGYQGSNVLLIQNLMHAGKIAFQAETTAGVSRKMLELLPNGGPSVTLLEVGVAVVQSKTASTGGLEVNNTLTGGGFERVLTESDGVQLAVKKADTSRSSTTTLADDPDLAITVDGTAYYAVTIHGHVTCAAAGIDMKYALDGATGRIIQALFTYAPETSTTGGVAIFGESTDQGNGGTMDLDGVFQYSFTYTGYVYFSTGGAGARTIEFTWAQNISNATAVVLKEGSWMTVQKVGDF